MNVLLSLEQLHKPSMEAISSKSYVHRLLIGAALSQEPDLEIRSNIVSKDMEATVRCLNALGADIETVDGCFRIGKGVCGVETGLLDCGESGSTARFLLPAAALFSKQFIMRGEGKLPQRPLGPLTDTLREHGMSISSDFLPLEGKGEFRGGHFILPGNVSSQFISGLLFALPLLEENSRIELTTPLESAGYVDMTLDVLSSFGIRVTVKDNEYEVEGGQAYHYQGKPEAEGENVSSCKKTLGAEGKNAYPCKRMLKAEGDWSNAGYLMCMGALGDGISLSGLNPYSRQQDRRVAEILGLFGADIKIKGNGVEVIPGKISGIDIDVTDIPDLVPALSVVAAYGEGDTLFRNVGRLRIKESDRIEAIRHILTMIDGSGKVVEEDGRTNLIIHGKGWVKSSKNIIEFDGFSDHRIVMAEAMTSLREKTDIIINGGEAVNKSYPGFFEEINKFGVCAREV